MTDVYKLVTFGSEVGTGSSVSLLESNKHQSAIIKAFQAGAEDAIKFSSELKEINSATLEWKNKILVKMSDFDSAIATAQAKAGEILGKSGVQINPALNVEDVVILDYEKELKGFELKQTKERVKQMLGSFEQVGEHRYKYSVPIPLSTYEQMLKDNEDLQKLPDFTSKRNKLPLLQNGGNGGNGGDGGNGGEDDDNNGNGDKESESKKLLKATSIIALLTSIVNIIRRILTAVLERGSEIKRVSENALQYGTNYSTYRDFEIQEKSMGLPEGTFSGALGSIQNAFGNIADLNEKALEKLAPVVGSQLKDMVLMGMGASNPMGIMELILDSYFKRGLSGYNSLGKYVGEVEAQRELTSALEKAGFSELARTLNNMFYTNNFGIYKGQIGSETPFQDYLGITKGIPSGFTAIEYAHLAEIGQVIDNISAKFDQLGKQLKDKFLLDLEGVLNWINDLEIGMTATQRLEKKYTKEEQAEKRVGEMRSTFSAISELPAIKAFMKEYNIKDLESFLTKPEKYKKSYAFLDDNQTGEKNNLIAPLLLASQILESIDKINKNPSKYNASENTDDSLALKSLSSKTPLMKALQDVPTVGKTFKVLAKDALGLDLSNIEEKEEVSLYEAIINSTEYAKLKEKKDLTKEEKYLMGYVDSFKVSRGIFGKTLTRTNPALYKSDDYAGYVGEKENQNLMDTMIALLSVTSNKDKLFSLLNLDKEYASSVIFNTGDKRDNIVHLNITLTNKDTKEKRSIQLDLQGTETETEIPIDLTSSFANAFDY
jgi:hypothetical protein